MRIRRIIFLGSLFVIFSVVKLSFSPFYFDFNKIDNCEKEICVIREHGKICSRDIQRNEFYGFYGYAFVRTNVMPINSEDEFGILFYSNFCGRVCVSLYGPKGLVIKEHYTVARGMYRYFIFKPIGLEAPGKYTLKIIGEKYLFKLSGEELVFDKLDFELAPPEKTS